MRSLTQHKNDQLENEVNIISNGNKDSINNHYKLLRKWQIKISDKEAWNFGIMEILVLIIISASLLVSTNFLGTYNASASMGLVKDAYVAAVVVQPGTSAFTFTPASAVTGTTYRLKGTGAYTLVIS